MWNGCPEVFSLTGRTGIYRELWKLWRLPHYHTLMARMVISTELIENPTNCISWKVVWWIWGSLSQIPVLLARDQQFCQQVSLLFCGGHYQVVIYVGVVAMLRLCTWSPWISSEQTTSWREGSWTGKLSPFSVSVGIGDVLDGMVPQRKYPWGPVLSSSRLSVTSPSLDGFLPSWIEHKCDRLCINRPFTARYRNPVFYIILLPNFCC